MTSIPVKDVAGLMNFVGTKPAAGTGAGLTDGFGDIMSKAQGDNRNNTWESTKTQQTSPRQADKNLHQDAYESRKDAGRKETQQVQSPAKEDAAIQDTAQTAEDAGSKMVKEVAQELEVSEEDVLEAMEILGLSAAQLFDPAAMTQLVVALSGEPDSTALLTDENLFGKLQNLLQEAADQMDVLAKELDMEPEQLRDLLSEAQSLKGQEVPNQILEEAAPKQQEAPKEADAKITLEVRSGDETVTMTADENGNVEKTLSVTKKEQPSDGKQEHEGEGSRHKDHEGALQSGNQGINELLQSKASDAQPVENQQAPMFSQQTQEIMNQILDYMRIQLRPEVDQLEMQLHPASLGSVHIHLQSKGGEVTAQFQVQNETVRAVLESQMVELKDSLREQGIKVEAVQVTVESHGFESNLWQGQGREENAFSERGGRGKARRINLNELENGLEEDASEEEILAAKLMEANGNTVDFTA